MYTVAERESLRDALVETARADERVAGAALTGSAAVGAEDEWSDVDLALGLAADADQDAILADWTAFMYSKYGALHHTDVWSRGTVYRVFLLASTLQVDIGLLAAWCAALTGSWPSPVACGHHCPRGGDSGAVTGAR